MHTHRVRLMLVLVGVFLIIGLFGLAGCTPGQPPLMTDFSVTDFDAVHSPVAGKNNKYLVLGKLMVAQPSVKLPPELNVYLGRWEGISNAPPVRGDRKIVLVVQEINAQGGVAVYWSGSNLQYPDVVGTVHFRVVPGRMPVIEWQVAWPDGSKTVESFMYVSKKNQLEGSSRNLADNHTEGPLILTHDQNFFIYKDYPQYLSGKSIYASTYQNDQLKQYGPGYLYYLPDGYTSDSIKSWPLIFFLHGYGDRGDNIFALAKSSPFMYVRDQGSLPAIIVAPLLSVKAGNTFPNEYLDGSLAEIRANFRVDPKRIYLTGLSMGGEATWRFALHQPETFAAIAPLSAYLDNADPLIMKSIVSLPVWAIHGADDTLIPVERGQKPVDALKAAGGNVLFSVLEGHDHDVWTDTYSDLAFYDWLLQQHRP
jgi:predicted esterase